MVEVTTRDIDSGVPLVCTAYSRSSFMPANISLFIFVLLFRLKASSDWMVERSSEAPTV